MKARRIWRKGSDIRQTMLMPSWWGCIEHWIDHTLLLHTQMSSRSTLMICYIKKNWLWNFWNILPLNLYHILSMDKSAIINQIQREYALWLNYVRPVRIRYRDRIMKRNPQNVKSAKIININMIWNYIDTLIASFFTNWVKCKFISRQGWIWEEEAQNLNAVAEFDEREWATQQLKYQVKLTSMPKMHFSFIHHHYPTNILSYNITTLYNKKII